MGQMSCFNRTVMDADLPEVEVDWITLRAACRPPMATHATHLPRLR
jgi:hypothetical protein